MKNENNITSEEIYNRYESAFSAVHAGIKIAKMMHSNDETTDLAYNAYLKLKEHDSND